MVKTVGPTHIICYLWQSTIHLSIWGGPLVLTRHHLPHCRTSPFGVARVEACLKFEAPEAPAPVAPASPAEPVSASVAVSVEVGRMEGDWGDKGGCRCQLFDDQALKPLLAELRNDFRKEVQEVEMHEKFCQTYDVYDNLYDHI